VRRASAISGYCHELELLVTGLPIFIQEVVVSVRAPGIECPMALAGLATDMLSGSAIGCPSDDATMMQRGLQQFLVGYLDT
jgi:hypothetical protein